MNNDEDRKAVAQRGTALLRAITTVKCEDGEALLVQGLQTPGAPSPSVAKLKRVILDHAVHFSRTNDNPSIIMNDEIRQKSPSRPSRGRKKRSIGLARTVYSIETVGEFICLIDGWPVSELCLEGWVFQGVDLTSVPLSTWEELCLSGTCFWGCTLPAGSTPSSLRARGAEVLEAMPGLPFKPYRAFMYTQDELARCDAAIFEHYKLQERRKDVRVVKAQATHDFSVERAVRHYLRGKSAVVFMGGHALRRRSAVYGSVVRMAWALARAGFVVVTGGGPGGMEAANLGAYLREESAEGVAEALRLIACSGSDSGCDGSGAGDGAGDGAEEVDEGAAAVLRRFGAPTHMPSLGVPTYKYGHEPSNKFATYHAKMFSNAVREDGLIQFANAGIVNAPGGPGTLQEVFQAACRNHYCAAGEDSPITFLDAEGTWSQSGVFDIVRARSEGKPYHDWLLCSDDEAAIVDHLTAHADAKALPRIVSDQQLLRPWWHDKVCPHTPGHF